MLLYGKVFTAELFQNIIFNSNIYKLISKVNQNKGRYIINTNCINKSP